MANETGNLDEVAGTGIPGLDHVIRGGLPRNRMYLVQGDPGSGKTTMGLQFLLEGARRGETGIYVSFRRRATRSSRSPLARLVARRHPPVRDCGGRAAAASGDENTLFEPSEIELRRDHGAAPRQDRDASKPAGWCSTRCRRCACSRRAALRYRRQILGLKQFFAGRRAPCSSSTTAPPHEDDRQLQSLAHGVITLEQPPPDTATSGGGCAS